MSATAHRAMPAWDGNAARPPSRGGTRPPGRHGRVGGPCWMKGGAGGAPRPAGPGRGFSGMTTFPAQGSGPHG